MCCSESRANRINAESVKDNNIEVRQGRCLHIVTRNLESTASSACPSAVRVNSWLGKGNEKRVISPCTEDPRLTERTSKIVIFFIHGVGGCSEIWTKQMEYFSKLGYTVVAPDMLGHGGSPTPRNSVYYTFTELANDMFAVFDRYRSRKRNVLVGHSYGCSFCTNIASQRPRQVSKLILISGGGPVPLIPAPCHLFCLPSFILACLNPCVVWTFQRMGFHAPSSQDKIQSTAFGIPSFVLRATMMGQTWNEGDEQFHLDLMVPALLIYGNHDHFVTLEEETYMNQTIYGSILEVLEDAGHMVMLECPEKVNELMLQFLSHDMSTQSGDEVIEPGSSHDNTITINNFTDIK